MIKDLLLNKTSQEKSQIKSLEIAKLKHSGIYDSSQYGVKIEIIGEVKAIEVNGQHCIELFARAWRGTQQLGFGADGSVEIERFRIFNPPILVDDPSGTIIREWTDEVTGEIKQRKLREDPIEATRQVISHNAKIVGKDNGKIVIGKVGNTTSTFYPSLDGWVERDFEATYADAHDATSGEYSNYTEASFTWASLQNRSGTPDFSISRSFFLFDTSALSDTATISSATLSIVFFNVTDTNGNDSLSIVSSNPASNTSLVNDDFDQLGTTKFATDKTLASLSEDAYANFALNATGISAISKTSITKFGLRNANDISNIAPTGVGNNGVYARGSETAGTTSDPTLVVVDDSPLTISLSASIAIESKSSKIGINKTASLSISELKISNSGVNKTTSLSFVESSSKNIGKRTLTELFSFVESSSTASAFQRNPTESLSFVESMSSLSDFKKAFSDNCVFAESLSKQSGKSISDSFLIVESIATISAFQIALAESVTLSEAILKTIIFQRMISEILNISDALSKAANLSFSSALSITETVLTTSAYSRSLTENITIVESLLRLAEFKLNFSSIISIAENLTKQTELSFIEALSILESFIKTSAFNLQKVDTFALAEAISKQIGKPISDLVTILDIAPIVARGLITSATDSVSISEQFIKAVGLGLSASVAMSESSTRLINFIRSFSDSVQITETLAKQLGLSLQELTTLTENLTKLISQRKQETISITESKTFSTNLGKTEIVSFTESFRKEAIKQNVDSFQISETRSKSSSLIVTDAISIQDILKFENVKKITDIFAITESIMKTMSIPLSSMLLITENVAKHTQQSLSINISISESHTATSEYAVHIVDSVALLEMLVKEFDLSITDASVIAASISLNYMSAFATQRTTVLTGIQRKIVLLAR